MYCSNQDRQELEDELYRGDGYESEGSEAISELEFHLYSQLHYSSNAGDFEQQDEEDQPTQEINEPEKTAEKINNVELKESPKNGPQLLNTIKPQQQHKSEKCVNKKKGKELPKVHEKLSPFEEVIVIESSSEVISVSSTSSEEEDDDDDKGVCALKGGIGRRVRTSTLAHTAPPKKDNNFAPVILDSSSSGSDSESESKSDSESSLSSNSSDSDVLENWMILGQGQQDGDHSISLNLEGSADINVEEDKDGSWVILDKDREAQIFNKERRARIAISRFTNRYYTDKNVHCRNCDKMGHLSKNCHEPKKLPVCFLCGHSSHMASECPYKHCNNCGLPGHLYNSCTERAYYHKQCHRCGMTGHFFDACPEIWRQYHISTKMGPPLIRQKQDNGRRPAYCYNCSQEGHFGHGCNQKRMFRGSFASTPFINYYDTNNDIKRRQQRLKFKVKELMKNGLLSNNSQSPFTPGPPHKKQKTSHANNEHLFNNHFDRTPRSHKATGSHIFFHHTNEVAKSTFKKHKQESKGKQWKPKRPVPKEKPAPPKLIVDEMLDFPRGGAIGEKTEKKKKKSKKNNKSSAVGLNGGGLLRTAAGKSKKDNRAKKSHLHKKKAAQMYPTDENLFCIKQRKRKR
nr:zinc finger CCHC domain-containing protein 7 [Nerophis lumbriciformis]